MLEADRYMFSALTRKILGSSFKHVIVHVKGEKLVVFGKVRVSFKMYAVVHESVFDFCNCLTSVHYKSKNPPRTKDVT